jgi:hypothetical protein
MQIQAINTYSTSSKPNFKAAYPVVHWLAESNGSYSPVVTREMTEILQNKLVRLLNRTGSKANEEKVNTMWKAVKYLASSDAHYNKLPFVRSFYNREGGWLTDKFEPISYLITGQDANIFEQNFAKPIGVMKSNSPKINGRHQSAELDMALNDYAKKGLNFVKNLAKQFCDKEKMNYSLHTKFETVRNSRGEIKDYKLVGLKFCPAKGKDNPLERLGYIKP